MKLVLGCDFDIRLGAGDSNPLKRYKWKKQPASNNNKSA
jgi:hypothetical protein